MSPSQAPRHGPAHVVSSIHPWWQALPLAAVFAVFFLVPLGLVLMVSFWNFNEYELLPDFTWRNYLAIFEGCSQLTDHGDLCVSLSTYLSTLKFTLLTWAVTLVLGFTVAYFLAFHVRSAGMQTLLFVLCTVPFWTSNVIRMISWVPLLGRNGLVNDALLEAGTLMRNGDKVVFSRRVGENMTQTATLTFCEPAALVELNQILPQELLTNALEVRKTGEIAVDDLDLSALNRTAAPLDLNPGTVRARVVKA